MLDDGHRLRHLSQGGCASAEIPLLAAPQIDPAPSPAVLAFGPEDPLASSAVPPATPARSTMLPTPVTQRTGMKGLSLMEKLKRSWNGEEVDPKVTKLSDHMANFCFMFIAVSELYVVLGFVIPYRFRAWTDMQRYYVKVFACYVYVQTLANWLCVRCYTSKFTISTDRPDLIKQLWDVHPQDIISANGKTSPKSSPSPADEGIGDTSISSLSANLSLHWHYCYSCHMKVPPRAHHCNICKTCILRRDHHCYMSGVCVGHANMRYFIVMNFYIAIASWYGLYEIAAYLSDKFYPTATASDWFLPKTIYLWFVYEDVIPTEVMLMIVHCYFLWWTGFTAIGFFAMQLLVTYRGLTTHESRFNVPVRSAASTSDNFCEVFGALWLLNFLWPAQIVFRQLGNGTNWPSLKPDRAKLIHNLREKARSGVRLREQYSRTDAR